MYEHATGPDFPLLTAMVTLPLLGAALVALVPRSRVHGARQLGVAISSAVGALSVWTMVEFDRADSSRETCPPST